MAFQGAAPVTLDDKGRLAIPARQREVLKAVCDGNVVITAHPHRCLMLVPEITWPTTLEKLTALSSYLEQTSIWKRLMVGHAETQQIDNAGRILVSQTLRKFARLDKRVMMVGQGSHFELWDLAAWDKLFEDLDQLGQKGIPPGMERFAL